MFKLMAGIARLLGAGFVKLFMYSGIPISRTLIFSNLPITPEPKVVSPPVEHCNFTSDFSNSLGGSKNRDSTVSVDL